MEDIYSVICSDWMQDAQQEDSKYFYHIREMDELISGRKRFVIGRKGAGKTAISKQLYEKKAHNIFTQKLSFKNFPFNFLYSLDNVKYTAPNQFITIWKYLIYSCICKLMLKNQNIDNSARERLTKLYDDSPILAFDRLVEHWTTKEFSAEILGVGLGIGGEKKAVTLSWIDATNILEDFIFEYIDTSTYLIIFDELDEDYRPIEDTEERHLYINLLTSLFKATQEICCRFTRAKKIFPIVFLRHDIFVMLRDSDKNKWRDFIIYLEWDIDKLKEMLDFRLATILGDTTIRNPWDIFFSKAPVYMGHRQHRGMSSFDFIARSTQWRPRDFIFYIKVCAEQVISRNRTKIIPGIIKHADDAFSDYLRAEIVDEVHPIMPHIEEVFSILSKIRKQTLPPQSFISEYNRIEACRKTMSAEDTLGFLFTFNIIGNQPSMSSKNIFNYKDKNARFNYRENIMIHRGLFKTLQIF